MHAMHFYSPSRIKLQFTNQPIVTSLLVKAATAPRLLQHSNRHKTFAASSSSSSSSLPLPSDSNNHAHASSSSGLDSSSLPPPSPELPLTPPSSLPEVATVPLRQMPPVLFSFFAATSLAFAAVALITPSTLLKLMLPSTPPSLALYISNSCGSIEDTLMRVAGSTLLVAWAAETGLKEAAVHKRLESATYRRLSLGCAIKSLLYIGAFFYSSRLWCPALIVIYPSLACLSYMVNHWTLLSNQFIATQKQMKEPNGNFDIMAIYFSLKEFLPRFKPSPSAPPSAQKEASVYCIISIVYFVVAIGCYLFPLDLIHANLPPRPTDEVLGRILQDRQSFIAATCTPGFILASAACQVLMDAAERGRLNGGTFRRLNLGLGLMEVLLAFTLVSSSVFPGPVEATMGLGIHLIASLFAAFFFISNFFKYPAKT